MDRGGWWRLRWLMGLHGGGDGGVGEGRSCFGGTLSVLDDMRHDHDAAGVRRWLRLRVRRLRLG